MHSTTHLQISYDTTGGTVSSGPGCGSNAGPVDPSTLLGCAAEAFLGRDSLGPHPDHQRLPARVTGVAFSRWITSRMFQPRSIQIQYDEDPTLHEIKLNAPATVQNLVQAEKHLDS